MKCPKCNNEMECEFVDIGVGMQQCTPYGCQQCQYTQGDPIEDRRMKFLVWFLNPYPKKDYPEYVAQLWADTPRSGDGSVSGRAVPTRIIALVGAEQDMTLDELMKRYPQPTPEPR